MKKLISLTSTLILSGLLILSISSCNTDKHGDHDKYLKKIKQLEEEIVELKTQLNLINDSRPSNIIGLDTAKILYHNYANTRVKWTNTEIDKIKGEEGFEATESLYYNLDSLYNYLAYIKRISKEGGITPSGLKFYFGSYGKDYIRDDKKDYAYRQTIFITPFETIIKDKKTLQLGYTFDDELNPIYLDSIFNSRGHKAGSSGSIQKAGFFNFNTSILNSSNSTVANELGGSPPKGEQQ